MNLVLIGMPCSGKSTVGVLLAKELCCDFIDGDILLQCREQKKIQQILDEDGLEAFNQKEEDALCSIETDNTVIAPGGSAVYSEKSMEHLRQNAKVIYIETPLEEIRARIENLPERGIAGLSIKHFTKIYKERKELYEKYADIVIPAAGLTKDALLKKILKELKK